MVVRQAKLSLLAIYCDAISIDVKQDSQIETSELIQKQRNLRKTITESHHC